MSKDGWPERINLVPTLEEMGYKVIDAALWVGRLFTRQVVHDPRPVSSDHYHAPTESPEVQDGAQET